MKKQKSSKNRKELKRKMADVLDKNIQTLSTELQEILLGDMVKRQGILDHKVVKAHVEKISKQGIGPNTLVSEADRVFAVIIFTLWYDIFFKETGIES